jgi:hypothetical protein
MFLIVGIFCWLKIAMFELFDDPKCVSQYILQSTSSKPTFPMLFNLRAKILHKTSNDCQLEMNLTVPFPFGKRMSTADAEVCTACLPFYWCYLILTLLKKYTAFKTNALLKSKLF